METEVSGETPELTEHEQEMVDLVDKTEEASAGAVDPENASEYVEPIEGGDDEVDYKAKYEELLNKGPENNTKAPEGLKIDPSESAEIAPEEAQEVSTLTPAQMGKFTSEFNDNGNLSDESYSELNNIGLSKEVVDGYIQGQTAILEAQHTKVYKSVGGEEAYGDMIGWAKDSWTPEQVAVFNTQVQSGNDAQIMFGIDSLSAQYKAAQGSPMPKRALSGSTQATSGGSKGYDNKGEMYKAMRSPMYGKDASYTKSVAKKIEQSTF